MPRRPRVDAPGCVQHVMVRGIERRVIFVDDADRGSLLQRLSRVLPESGMLCFAWALMPNHVHLLVRTRDVPLARVMARVNTGHAAWFNDRHDRVGHLFQNRYKSVVVEDDAQLLATLRYVHLNPVRAGLVEGLAALASYPWAGHAGLMGRHRQSFHSVEAVLGMFASDHGSARRAIEDWMSAADEPVQDPFCRAEDEAEARQPSVASRHIERLTAEVCQRTLVSVEALRARRKHPDVVRARDEIAYRARVELGMTKAEIARMLGMAPSTVLAAIERGRRRADG